MTEFWKSNPMHWCDVCKCWMNDSKAARQNHERGMGHKANLERKLRDMAKKSDMEKRDKERTASALNRIEDEAQKRFQEDQAAMEKASGTWVWDVSATYYYNEKFRWYYDPETKWYYGGDPPQWTQSPPIPGNAMFGVAKHVGGPIQQPSQPASASAGGATGRPATATATAARPLLPSATAAAAAASAAAAGAKEVQVQKKVVELPKHPLMAAGGHRAPEIGRVGAAKGVGLQGVQQAAAPAAAGKPGAAGDKRKREGEKEMSEEEKAFQAKREAARARVQQRTAQQFGYL